MSIFAVTEYDQDKALEASRALVEAYERTSGGSVDSGAVGTALALAVEAFPGLQDFVDGSSDGVTMQLSAVQDGVDGRLLAAVADLAAVGALAEVYSGFDWSEVDPVHVQVREALDGMSAAAPGMR